MRDPDGLLSFEPERVVRHLRAPLSVKHFLWSGLAVRWVRDGLLVPFTQEDDSTIASPRLPFVTHPSEWCNLQAYDAAVLTSRLQAEAVQAGFDMKDASAWNVIFDGARPVFCDLLSFEPLVSRPWWAAGQFARHFLLPLLLAKRRQLQVSQAFKIWRDGVPPVAARELLGPGRFFTRYWPLMAGADSAVHAMPRRGQGDDGVGEGGLERLRRHRVALQASFNWMLAGVRPTVEGRGSAWQRYEGERTHYTAQALEQKRSQIDEWLSALKPECVLDLGCNAGEFSIMARSKGALVVAVDADHDSIERLYRRLNGAPGIHAVLAPLDDLCGGRGWNGKEFPGLPERLTNRFDVVMMLALVHHLMVGASVPLPLIAQFVHRCSCDRAVVEFIDVADVQLRRLCQQRQRQPEEFSLDRQRSAFVAAGFVIESEVALSGSHRYLALLRRS